jgi:hypothetical protein
MSVIQYEFSRSGKDLRLDDVRTLSGLTRRNSAEVSGDVDAGSVWIAPLEGTRWRPYGESTDSQESRLGLVASMAMPGREQWLRKSAPKGGVESAIRGEKR